MLYRAMPDLVGGSGVNHASLGVRAEVTGAPTARRWLSPGRSPRPLRPLESIPRLPLVWHPFEARDRHGARNKGDASKRPRLDHGEPAD